MIRYLATISFLLLGLMDSALALPWFQAARDLSKLPTHQTQVIQNNSINFSGVWVGQCDNTPAVDLVIKHINNNLSISYGFMEEKYTLGEVKSDVKTALNASEHNNIMVRWSNDKTSLIFINSNLFINAAEHLNVFFSKVSMTLEQGRLIVTGYHYQTDGSLGDFNQETMLCNYQRK